ncbi:hypothetical protein VMCG_10220 [Cytospora schulzeri]|uniref:Uncharacterized protein n=1 Tax=Cytospora schulzeri TaxID=448051 RepID=A0A423VER9_9PEZI|nr:hypothetical protein VMCG_10220 [Valsa malicola]
MGETPLYQKPVSVIREDEVGSMLPGIKDYLRGVTRENTGMQDQDHLLETEYSSSQAPMSIVASTTVDPATTITISEASFTPAVGTDDGGPQRAQTATTSTLISQDNVTEITWLHPRISAPLTDPELETTSEHQPPGTPESIDRAKNAETSRTLDHAALPYSLKRTPVDSQYSITVNYMPGSSTGNNVRQRRQSSMVVFTDGNELDLEGGPQSVEESGQPTTVLGRIRKKSVQFGQAMGSFMNGAYRNSDHKPRRDSSVVRMRGILDRIQPSMPRPEEDLDIYTAFTGARPITAIDQYNALDLFTTSRELQVGHLHDKVLKHGADFVSY